MVSARRRPIWIATRILAPGSAPPDGSAGRGGTLARDRRDRSVQGAGLRSLLHSFSPRRYQTLFMGPVKLGHLSSVLDSLAKHVGNPTVT